MEVSVIKSIEVGVGLVLESEAEAVEPLFRWADSRHYQITITGADPREGRREVLL